MKDDPYNFMATTYKTRRGDIIVVMGGLNAKVGADRRTLEHVMGSQAIGRRNDNGEKFVDSCNSNHLVIEETVSQHKPAAKTVGYRLMFGIKIKLITLASRDVLGIVCKMRGTREAKAQEISTINALHCIGLKRKG